MNTPATLFGIIAVIEAALLYWAIAVMENALNHARTALDGWKEAIGIAEKAITLFSSPCKECGEPVCQKDMQHHLDEHLAVYEMVGQSERESYEIAHS